MVAPWKLEAAQIKTQRLVDENVPQRNRAKPQIIA
jgi:hypothetical protein